MGVRTGGTAAELRAEADRQRRAAAAVVTALPYFLLAACTTVTAVLALRGEAVSLLPVFGLSAAAAAWIAWFHAVHPGRPPGSAPMAVYYAGLLTAAAALVVLAPWYGLFAFTGYPQAFHCLAGRWRYVGAGVTATVSAAAFFGGGAGLAAEGTWLPWIGVAAVSTVISAGVFFFAETEYVRDDKQKTALVRLEAALAENAALRDRLVAQARAAGVLDERQRMARELHDTLAQGLAGVLTQLQAAEQRLAEPEAARGHLGAAVELARDSLAEARRSVHAVRPAPLDGARLPDAVAEVARRWSAAHGVPVETTTTGRARPLRTDVEVALLRTAQEALANVAKHARAGRVGLTLSYMEDLVTLDVRDDGVGFDPGAATGDRTDGGFGLAGMRERVQRLAGRLAVESEPGGGTAVSAAVPAFTPGEQP